MCRGLVFFQKIIATHKIKVMEDEVYKSVLFRFNVIFREVLSNLLLITSGAKKLRPPL